MGNCLETCVTHRRPPRVTKEIEQEERETESARAGRDDTDLVREKKSGMRVKIVLTKEELEWLMIQLENKKEGEGERSTLEDVLDEIEKGRRRNCSVGGWKPSLESIVECPEVPEFMTR